MEYVLLGKQGCSYLMGLFAQNVPCSISAIMVWLARIHKWHFRWPQMWNYDNSQGAHSWTNYTNVAQLRLENFQCPLKLLKGALVSTLVPKSQMITHQNLDLPFLINGIKLQFMIQVKGLSPVISLLQYCSIHDILEVFLMLICQFLDVEVVFSDVMTFLWGNVMQQILPQMWLRQIENLIWSTTDCVMSWCSKVVSVPVVCYHVQILNDTREAKPQTLHLKLIPWREHLILHQVFEKLVHHVVRIRHKWAHHPLIRWLCGDVS